ncbi:hypothetical protein GOBAR_AA16666 [Gossypium barbadense]|uniref:PCI domain-containing protein n=1 Tax=Gossypium barbadense TaxID=3634 RepID=A0A2P5XL38_GOSBA|nr:hypothetical protein GOBAR_AA16666 [Gossypium barbadense]
MDIEQNQAELIDNFVKQASAQKGTALGSVILEATSHPSLFAFSEILAVPTVAELEGTENSVYLKVLQLFAHGTWSDYRSNCSSLPQLVPDQVLKLKQLTVLTLAETNKVLPYDELMMELDVMNVRELEDFLINECMYAIQFAAGRDLRPGQLGSMIQTLSNWLGTSDNLLVSIQEKIKWADTMSELDKKHRKEVEARVEEVKKSISVKTNCNYVYVIHESGIRSRLALTRRIRELLGFPFSVMLFVLTNYRDMTFVHTPSPQLSYIHQGMEAVFQKEN